MRAAELFLFRRERERIGQRQFARKLAGESLGISAVRSEDEHRSVVFAQGSGDAARPFSAGGDSSTRDINMVLDIPVQLSVELGRTKVSIKHILQLGQGSVVELDALAGEPMDVLVNGYLIAQGEVVVVNDKFGIRLTDVVTPSERLRRINKG